MTEPFTVRVTVRAYETDAQGHLTAVAYLQYAEHARWELLRAAGLRHGEIQAAGFGPVTLETTIRYHREVVVGDDVDISCALVFGEGKTFRVEQRLTCPDGSLVAEVSGVGGLLDLTERKLVRTPRDHFRSEARDPGLLGL
ncbi:acyl-CoA thioesterase [Streptomyces oceani]|uniref:Thioesterase n=1 Tax=Streptomyces oceani TaxID=1075402 RepID=A0A1E7KJC3_9ACTN|nr:acyl-CoA thioesterase [Streptomyces oceani]OEV04059.1 thioesterase [Streptomyces oceani]